MNEDRDFPRNRGYGHEQRHVHFDRDPVESGDRFDRGSRWEPPTRERDPPFRDREPPFRDQRDQRDPREVRELRDPPFREREPPIWDRDREREPERPRFAPEPDEPKFQFPRRPSPLTRKASTVVDRPKIITTNQLLEELQTLKKGFDTSPLQSTLSQLSQTSTSQFSKLSEQVQTIVNLLTISKKTEDPSRIAQLTAELSKSREEFKDLESTHAKLRSTYDTLHQNYTLLLSNYQELKQKEPDSASKLIDIN